MNFRFTLGAFVAYNAAVICFAALFGSYMEVQYRGLDGRSIEKCAALVKEKK